MELFCDVVHTPGANDQSLYEIHIVSHIWPFSLPDKI